MADFSIDTLRSIYFTNQPYRYPNPWLKTKSSGGGSDKEAGNFGSAINTGWHIIPNFLWGHVCNPRQWWEMVIKYEAISVQAVTCRIFNPIPIQTALSFQGTNTFPAFNNTVYALTYTDDLYETPWFPWHDNVFAGNDQISMFYEFNPEFKEGLIPKKRSGVYPPANDTADSLDKLYDREDIYPVHYPTQITQNLPGSYQIDSYRRQFLPIYWYHFPYCQYKKPDAVGTAWRQQITLFEEMWLDMSGAFWDPLNRPDSLGELRPGKNMVEYSWNVHPSDEGIWFNTDRPAFPTPYPRPRPLQTRSNVSRMARYQSVNPIGPGRRMTQQVKYMMNLGLINKDSAVVSPEDQMCPEGWTGLPNWRDFPLIPTRWFAKEIQESNPWVYQNMTKRYYKENTVQNCPTMNSGGTKKGDVEITGPCEDMKYPGTEYEMHKYPMTQWFIKAIPLYDDKENHIPVEMQAFMHISVKIKGKPRRSAIYAPTWGPIAAQDLYSVNMDSAFGENYIRGRSGGARRTWYDPEDTRPVRNVPNYDILLYSDDAGSTAISQPHEAGNQCIIEPATGAVMPPQWPRVNSYSTADRMAITIDQKTGKRSFSNKPGKCAGDSGVCYDD